MNRLVDCSYLQLVLAGLGLRRRVEEVDRENLMVDTLDDFRIDGYGGDDGATKIS